MKKYKSKNKFIDLRNGRFNDRGNNGGITLIALVVTLIVLLILAGITISTVFSENGLIQKVQQAKDAQLIATYQDRIEIVCLDWSLDKSLNDKIGVNDLWIKMKDAGIILDIERDVEKLDDKGNYVITVPEGYKFQIHINENGDTEVEYIGKEDALLPYIQSVEVIGKTTNSVTVEVTVTREGENLTLSYYYKKLNDPEENYVAIKENVEEKTVEVTGLESETIYQLKVIAKNENGENEKTVELTVEGIIGAGEGLKEGAIIASEPTWDSNSHTASITLSKGEGVESNLSIEWQINKIEEGSWTEGTNVTGLNHNDIVYARLTDGTNHGREASVTIKDDIAPNAPTISLSGTNGNNGYYKSNVTVTITAGSDGQSGENQVKYSVSGAQTINETTTAAGTTSASITISTDGTSTITAYTLDKAGNVSIVKTQVVYKDSTAPSTASLTAGTVGETSIAVTASGADSTSGVYSYQFQRSTTSSTSDYTTITTQTSTATNVTYTYTELTAETTYYLRVIVTDRAGNAKTSSVVTQATAQKLVADGSFNSSKGVNTPDIADGKLTPIKWNGSSWIKTTANDNSWYNYGTSSKQWANAVIGGTFDTNGILNEDATGYAMFVWIPRFAYQISSNYHNGGSGVSGTINIKFMQGTGSTAADGTNSWQNSSGQGNWNIHPAFEYNGTKAGIWVAKFEASSVQGNSNSSDGDNVTTKTLQIKPGVQSWRYITIENIFTICKNYNSSLNSHLIKNSEWGAVAYLSKSSYGINGEIWINPNSNYTTGQAGTSASASSTTSTYEYNNTTYGVKASTTGTIYGIYDISGGSEEYVAGYVNNSNGSLTSNGSSLVRAASYMKDVYASSGDTQSGNYNAAITKYGDAVYETSLNGSGVTSWFFGTSHFPYTSGPFFLRGGNFNYGPYASAFTFSHSPGDYGGFYGFRPVLISS